MRGLVLIALTTALLAPAAALAAKAPTQAQYTAQGLVKAMMKSASLKPLGLTWGKVLCVLPKNGNVFHCTVHTSSPKAQENIVFQVKATLDEEGNVKWTITSDACSDSKSGQKLSCSG
jgi:hypothetical protein